MERPVRVELPLLPGLRWTGKLTVIGVEPAGYTVQWDARDTDPRNQSPVIYDRTVLSAMQLEMWTGCRACPRCHELIGQRHEDDPRSHACRGVQS